MAWATGPTRTHYCTINIGKQEEYQWYSTEYSLSVWVGMTGYAQVMKKFNHPRLLEKGDHSMVVGFVDMVDFHKMGGMKYIEEMIMEVHKLQLAHDISQRLLK